MRTEPRDEVAVTGIGLVSAAGAGVAALRDVLAGGAACTGPVAAAAAGVREAAVFPSDVLVSGAPADRALAACRLASAEAWRDAMLGDATPTRVGLALGTALGGIEHLEEAVRRSGAPTSTVPRAAHPHALTLALAAEHRLGGPCTTFSATCVSALYALDQACLDLATGRADAVLCVGVDTTSRFMLGGFAVLDALRASGEDTGLVLGEAACCVVLERGADARSRGAAVRGVIAGRGHRADAIHLTSPDEQGRGMVGAIAACLRDAGCAAGDVDCVTVTAAASPAYARMYERVLPAVFGTRAVPTTSWEASIGHVLAASGALGVAHAGMLLDGVDATDVAKIDVVLALTVGFGGQNGATLVRRCRFPPR